MAITTSNSIRVNLQVEKERAEAQGKTDAHKKARPRQICRRFTVLSFLVCFARQIENILSRRLPAYWRIKASVSSLPIAGATVTWKASPFCRLKAVSLRQRVCDGFSPHFRFVMRYDYLIYHKFSCFSTLFMDHGPKINWLQQARSDQCTNKTEGCETKVKTTQYVEMEISSLYHNTFCRYF